MTAPFWRLRTGIKRYKKHFVTPVYRLKRIDVLLMPYGIPTDRNPDPKVAVELMHDHRGEQGPYLRWPSGVVTCL